MIILMVIIIGLFAYCTWGLTEDPMPVGLFWGFSLPLIAVVAGVILVMRERMKEIERGEIYEATKY